MIEILKEEKSRLFKVAADQLEVRVFNSRGNNIGNLINVVFSKLDIETLCPVFITSKKEKASRVINDALSRDVTRRIGARCELKKDKNLELWTISHQEGYKIELEKLRDEFKAIKEGRSRE